MNKIVVIAEWSGLTWWCWFLVEWMHRVMYRPILVEDCIILNNWWKVIIHLSSLASDVAALRDRITFRDRTWDPSSYTLWENGRPRDSSSVRARYFRPSVRPFRDWGSRGRRVTRRTRRVAIAFDSSGTQTDPSYPTRHGQWCVGTRTTSRVVMIWIWSVLHQIAFVNHDYSYTRLPYSY